MMIPKKRRILSPGLQIPLDVMAGNLFRIAAEKGRLKSYLRDLILDCTRASARGWRPRVARRRVEVVQRSLSVSPIKPENAHDGLVGAFRSPCSSLRCWCLQRRPRAGLPARAVR